MYAFLSDEWMAAAREIRERYVDDLPEIVQPVKLNLVTTDVPFGDGTINACIDTTDGSIELELGELDEPDVVLVTDYETAKAMFVAGESSQVMQAFLEGRLKVQGDMMKLMALQTAVPTNESSDRLAAEILAITE